MQLYVERWSGIGPVRLRPSLRVGTLTRTIYTSSCPRKIGRASERASNQLKKEQPAPSGTRLAPCTSFAVLHVTRGQERGKLKVSVAMEYRSREAGVCVRVPDVENKIPRRGRFYARIARTYVTEMIFNSKRNQIAPGHRGAYNT